MTGRIRKWSIGVLGIVASLLLGLALGTAGGGTQAEATAADVSQVQVTTAEVTRVRASGEVSPVAQAAFEEQAANALEAQIVAVYDAASPAVVNVTSRTYVTYRFMGTFPEEGTGSGFVYDTEGHIVTNYHVIEGAEELLVTLSDGQTYEAEVAGADATNDLAVLKIDAGADLPAPLAMADSDALRVGQFVVAIGNPYGLDWTLTTGVVSAVGRVIQSAEEGSFIGEAIQTDAAINPGNSGGPLLDLQGRVIGVNSQIISNSGSSAGIGFAVSSNTVQRVVPQLIANGYYAHPWLGVETMELTAYAAEMLREAGVEVPVDEGLLVLETEQGSPADAAGIEGASQWVRLGHRYQVPAGGDIVTAIDGRATDDLQSLTIYLEMETNIGDAVELTVLREGEELTIRVVLGEQPQW